LTLRPIGLVRSAHSQRADLPRQGAGSGLTAVIELAAELEPAARDIKPGDRVWVLCWFHLAERDLLRLHPQANPAKPERGVFSLRSPARPNPIGLTLVRVLNAEGTRIEVEDLDAVNGTPVIDIKPYNPDIDG
jgi:tRNA-Thr(GGU) m(6)t(6)A37 methyltransferase TsaA